MSTGTCLRELYPAPKGLASTGKQERDSGNMNWNIYVEQDRSCRSGQTCWII